MRTLHQRPIVLALACVLVFLLGPCSEILRFQAEAAERSFEAEPWRVLEKTGSVRHRLPGESSWSQVAVGDQIPAASRIVTDEDGFLVIERSGEKITIRPNGRFMLPLGHRTQRVRQEAGTLDYEITRMQERPFEVETPYASLVVKGTVFNVAVDDAGVVFEVQRGRVEVESRGGAKAELHAGQAARVTAASQDTLEVRPGPDRPFAPVEARRQSWFGRFLDSLQSSSSGGGLGDGSGWGGSDGGSTGFGGGVSTGGASAGGASVGGASVGGDGVGIGGASVGGVSAGGVSTGGASVGGASVGRDGVGIGGASVGGVSAGGVSTGGAGVGGASVGDERD